MTEPMVCPPEAADWLRRYFQELIDLRRENKRLRVALREVERTCPCGARPESPSTHPHVTSCPVGFALHPIEIDGQGAS